MMDEDYRLKIELAALEEKNKALWVSCLVIAALVSALVLVLGLACAAVVVAL